jgi:hypothetical protein
LICCSRGWPLWRCPIPVHCRCTNGHTGTVGCSIPAVDGHLVVVIDGHIDSVDPFACCFGWPQWHCPYNIVVRFLYSHHTDGFVSTVGSSCCSLVLVADCSVDMPPLTSIGCSLLLLHVGDRSVGMSPLTNLTPVIHIAGSTGRSVLL